MTSLPTESERRDYMPKLLVNGRKIAEEFAFLSSAERNSAFFSELTKAVAVDIGRCLSRPLPPSYRLIRIDGRLDDDKFEIALLDTATNAVVYYNRVIIVGDIYLEAKPVTQCLVWRTTNYPHSEVLHGVAGDVFFKYLLEAYQVIMSDNAQTGNGQQFWLTQISRALYENLFVYYYDSMRCKLQLIGNEGALEELKSTMWGEDDSYCSQLAIISKVEVPAGLEVEIKEGA